MSDVAIANSEVTTDAIAHAIDNLDALEIAIRIARLEWIVECDERQAWKEDGACSMPDWIAFRYGYARATSVELVRVAYAVRELPCVRAAFAEGRLS